MDKETLKLFKNFLQEISKKQVEKTKPKVHHKVLRDNIGQIENLKAEVEKILNNKELFEEKDFKFWTGCVALLIQSLDMTFSKIMQKRLESDLRESVW